MNRGFIISIEGIDGAGKTSVARELAASTEIAYLDRKESLHALGVQQTSVEFLRRSLWTGEDHPRDPVNARYWFFKLLAWYTALDALALPRAFANSSNVVVDGWIYRHVIKTSMRTGESVDRLLSMTSHLTTPVHVVLLTVDPARTWARRSHYAKHECGSWDHHDHTLSVRDRYIEYQGTVQRAYVQMAERLGWTVVDGNEHDVATLTAHIQELLGLDAETECAGRPT